MLPAPRTQHGLTLIELMVAIAVLAILLSVGIPSFQSMLAQNRATSAANELQSSLLFARSTALAQGRRVTICVANFATNPATCSAANNDWHGGWLVLMNNQVLRTQRALNPSVQLTGSPQWVFENTGTLIGQTIVPFELTVSSRPEASRRICMHMSGSSRIVAGGGTC